MMTLDQIRALVADDFDATNQIILDRLQSDVVLVNQVGHYIVAAGGKRLRPMLLLLAAKSLNYKGDFHPNLAAVIELIHTATLLHDDVVDESDLRRGRQTANAMFGNQASVLVGDYLYSRSFQMMVEVGEMRVMEVLSQTTNEVAAGEVLQLMNVNDPDVDEASYYQVIERKTAILFAAATQLAAILAGTSKNIENGLREYGLQLGNAFQLIDDALDYAADTQELGKNVGDDLAEGKPTLPLIYAMQHASESDAKMIRQAIEQGGLDNMEAILQVIEQTGAIEYTYQAAEQAVAKAISALEPLPDNQYKQALVDIARLSLKRNS
ncbi:octaprenyl diphosphate synthase [Kangiella aquimarina]|uniref:Octaprenyl diphosphate synthase n=1 Tax=Kangiella aquimarina TaxID=261965 RepID=A0ABZ0X301_9GAMM|nr:octaprenyl diphosphate synthase [Kangiella aquimarina]WQG84759.1 octaprenyl diphosphate synthase [Kangiella aquimarina]